MCCNTGCFNQTRLLLRNAVVTNDEFESCTSSRLNFDVVEHPVYSPRCVVLRAVPTKRGTLQWPTMSSRGARRRDLTLMLWSIRFTVQTLPLSRCVSIRFHNQQMSRFRVKSTVRRRCARARRPSRRNQSRIARANQGRSESPRGGQAAGGDRGPPSSSPREKKAIASGPEV